MIRNMIAVPLLAAVLSTGALAQSDHDHDHDHDTAPAFTSLNDGWNALEEVSGEIRLAVEAEDMDALHDLSSELHSVADRLRKLSADVPQENELRFTSSINQLRTLSDRLHTAHESGDTQAARQMVPQLEGVIQLLMVSAEAD